MDPSQKDIDECCLRVAAYYGERLNHLNKQQIESLNKALDNCFKRHCFKANGPTNDELEGCWEIMTFIWGEDGIFRPF